MTREPEHGLELIADGLRDVAAAGSKFEAELLAARLRNDGVRAMVGFDHFGTAYAAAATVGSGTGYWPAGRPVMATTSKPSAIPLNPGEVEHGVRPRHQLLG